jgi:ribosomal protein S18 acetylase RimI-like enzyme
MELSVEPLLRRHVADGVSVLTRAFLDNPATLAMLPYPEPRRSRALARAMRGFIEATRRAGDASVVCTGGRLGGVMLAFEPGSYPPRGRALAWVAYGPLTAGPPATMRYAAAGRLLRRLHPRTPHFYLFVLGVDPELQGRGLGGRLLGQLTERADRLGLPCYLETDKASSVRLYERHGFGVQRDVSEDGLGVRFWTMLRQEITVRKNPPR